LSLRVKNNPKNIPFLGGFFGIFNYDLVKTYEKIPQENAALINSRNITALYVKTFYVNDKKRGEKHIFSINKSTLQGKENAGNNIEKLLKNLSKPKNETSFKENVNKVNKDAIKSNTTRKEFMAKVKKAKGFIKNGDIFQVVLSQRFEMPFNKDPTVLLEKISQEKSTFKYYFNLKTFQVLGLSPEILVKKCGNKVITNPIAGTRKRGKTKKEERMLENDLIEDTKEKAEHTMLVDLARNDMGKIADIGTVDVVDFMNIKRYKNVIHLTSQVIGETKKDNLEILKTFLPAGTLTGAPKIRAMEIIECLEEDKREIYGGGIGYLGFNGNMEMAITIRSMVLKDHKAYIQAGAGIVYDSKPEREYEETIEKASQLIDLIKEVRNDSINR
jgi:anthranilate synthase component 1